MWTSDSRATTSCEFHFEGFSNFNASVEGLDQIQFVMCRIQNWNAKLIVNLCMFSVQCEELRIHHDLTLLLGATMPYACWFLWPAN